MDQALQERHGSDFFLLLPPCCVAPGALSLWVPACYLGDGRGAGGGGIGSGGDCAAGMPRGSLGVPVRLGGRASFAAPGTVRLGG